MARASKSFCEFCGAEVPGGGYRGLVEGAEMVLCGRCFERLSRSGRASPLPRPRGPPRRRARRLEEELELVEDYHDRIRRAREGRGWSPGVLAQRLRVSEALVRKLESGRLRPTLDLARRIEALLGVRLLEKAVYGHEEGWGSEEGLTLGDIVVVRRDED